ncbi:hypothetical protein MNBD_GAMMA24-2484 [hydrothermal vent metagenome]|uniref:Uncharacterized protein n=1 Tax=hydrothermal vent metagenome TaxID=652676 RepID=A0A3B1B0T3_9ZZZZ
MFVKGKTTRAIGQETESLACRYLQAQGLRLLERNFSMPQGEIDLIMQEGQSLVFIEVRYRRNNNFGSGAETITRNKQRKLLATAARYLQRNPLRAEQPARFDVVSIQMENNQPLINWIKNAFMASV